MRPVGQTYVPTAKRTAEEHARFGTDEDVERGSECDVRTHARGGMKRLFEVEVHGERDEGFLAEDHGHRHGDFELEPLVDQRSLVRDPAEKAGQVLGFGPPWSR